MQTIDFPLEKMTKSGLVAGLSHFLSEDFLNKLARQTKMVQRSTSKLNGQMFLALNALYIESLDETSLEDQCDYLFEEFGIKMTKQSLDERYNIDAVRFMRTLLGYLLQGVVVKPEGFEVLSTVFKNIYIEDATSFQLPAQLAAFYEGAGGSASKASIKIDLIFELISGAFVRVDIADGKTSDTHFLSTTPLELEATDLVLRDLGYLKHAELQRIEEAGAYFISRYKAGTNFFELSIDGDFVGIKMDQWLASIKQCTSKWLYYGEKKIPVRVVVDPLPDQIVAQRLNKLRTKVAKDKRWKLSQERQQLCRFNIFVCNFDLQIIDQQIIQLYTLRWQIKLIFKIWKSIFNLDKVQQMKNIFRFECYLYGQLIALCLSQRIISLFKEHLLNFDFELSEQKAFKQVKKNALN